MGVFTQKIDSIVSNNGIDVITRRINQAMADEKEDLVYRNQVECAIRLIKSFDDSVYPRCNHKIVEGLTQAGKTGVLKAAIMFLKLYGLFGVLNIKTFYYISGDNAKDMTGKNAAQIRKCFKEEFGCDFIALKNSDLRKNMEPTELTNAFVFIDECHYGVEDKRNVLIKWEHSKGFDMHNSEELVRKSMYVVSNSATPFSEEMSDVGETKQVIKLHVEEWDGNTDRPKYVGLKQYFQNGSFVEDVNRDSIKDNCLEIRNHIDNIKVRTGKEKVTIARIYGKRYLRVKCELEKHFKVYEFFQTNVSNIDYAAIEKLLLTGPKNNLSDKPIMIVIKGAFTMGNRIDPEAKKNIGAIYDVRTNCTGKNERKGVVSTIQGLPGRITGYWDTDDWKDIRIWVHEAARVKMSKYYYEQASSTPISGSKMVFTPDDSGEIGILPADDSITYYGVPKFNKGSIKASIVEFLESKDPKYKKMVKAVVSRYTKKSHMTKPYFSVAETEDVRIEANIGKPCYTFLYDPEESTIEVLYGTIMRGHYEPIEENNVRVETLLTTPKTTFVPDPNGTELDFIEWDVTEEYTNVPKFDKEYKNEVVKYLCGIDTKFKGCTLLGYRRNWIGHTVEHFPVPHISRAALTSGRYGTDILKDENIGKTYYSFLYDLDEGNIKVRFASLAKGRYETVYPSVQPVETLKTFKR